MSGNPIFPPPDAVHLYLEALDDAQSAKVRWKAARLLLLDVLKDPAAETETYRREARARCADRRRLYDVSRVVLGAALKRMIALS